MNQKRNPIFSEQAAAVRWAALLEVEHLWGPRDFTFRSEESGSGGSYPNMAGRPGAGGLIEAMAADLLSRAPELVSDAQVLMRSSASPEEWETLRGLLPDPGSATDLRVRLREGALILPRYSLMPDPAEVAAEVAAAGATLASPLSAFRAVATDLTWLEVLSDLTPRTWTQAGWATVPETPHGWVVRGRYSSRKTRWNTHMYAPDRTALAEVSRRLAEDQAILDQGLIYREYVPLLEVAPPGLNGLPTAHEWRFHFWEGTLLGAGFYWINQDDYVPPSPYELGPAGAPTEAALLAFNAAHRLLTAGMPWVSVDVAERADQSGWIVVEVNSGEQSGLQGCPPARYYASLLRLATLKARRERGAA